MHRSNFRPRNKVARSFDVQSLLPAVSKPSVSQEEFQSLKEQIKNIADRMVPIKGALESILAQQRHDNETVPSDLGKAVRSLVERLDRLERHQAKTGEQFSKMETTFSNALLKMGDQVEKISGGSDSEFSLAHSLETLIDVLSNRAYRVCRDNDGNMVKLETDTGKKYS